MGDTSLCTLPGLVERAGPGHDQAATAQVGRMCAAPEGAGFAGGFDELRLTPGTK
jgi:regulation of enolase protein 1 (concanavalin A-like superfamily)